MFAALREIAFRRDGPRLEANLHRFAEHALRGLGDGGTQAVLHPGEQKGILDSDRHPVLGDLDGSRLFKPVIERVRTDKLFHLLQELAFPRDRRLCRSRGVGLHLATPPSSALSPCGL